MANLKPRRIPDHNDPIIIALRSIRISKDMSQAALARRMGVAPCGVSRWELGDGDCLAHTLLEWARALGYKFVLVEEEK